MGADLHIHSTESDGELTPTIIVREAERIGLEAISITDHDCVDGVTEALLAAKNKDVTVIPGIEFSTIYKKQEIHILGYYIDISNRNLREETSFIVEERKTRAKKIIGKLKRLGIHLSYDRVQELAGGKIIGRPHIALAMIERGYINSVQQAFTPDYFDNNGKAFVSRYKMSPKRAIQLINEAKGVAVVAHPGLCYGGYGLKESDIKDLVADGLEGIEVYHSAHSNEQKISYLQIASKYNLLITGGSDFHGKSHKEGAHIGSIKLDDKYVKVLKEYVINKSFN
ncbi:MAG: PHP domain-containing protein [Clostridia bacterium]